MDTAALPPPDVEPLEARPVVQEPAVLETARLLTRPAPQERPAAVTRSLQADYGWLADTLHAEIERFKAYPYLAKLNRWQGQVVLHVVVESDGQVADIAVAQSSGHALLDEQAVALLRRIGSVPLRHPLKQPRVVLQIPIGYQLE
jgi:protein TonB